MTNSPPLSRILFAAYLLAALAVGMAALVWPPVREAAYAPVRDALLPNFYLNPAARIPVRLSLAVAPKLETWVKASAAEFSRQHDLITIDVTTLRGSDANRQLIAMTGLPDAWIAETEFVRTLAGGIPYQAEGTSLAQDSLLWVAATARLDQSGDLSWLGIARIAAGDPQFRIAMPPLNSVEGMAACYSAAEEYHNQVGVTTAQITDPGFTAWLGALRQAAPDLSRNPRDQLASRPPQADAGLILRSDWAQIAQTALRSQPPAFNVQFRYPYYIRSRWEDLTPEEAAARKSAAESFRDYLTGAAAQDQLAGYGLAKGGAADGEGAPVFDEATVRALQFCWR